MTRTLNMASRRRPRGADQPQCFPRVQPAVVEPDAGDGLVEPGLDGAHVANAAAELQGNVGRFDDALDRGHIDGLAGKGAVEIDHVEILEAHRLEGSRLRRRIALKHGGARHVALLEPYACAVLEVDGGKENHDDTRLTLFAGAASQARSDDRRGPPSLARAGNNRSPRRITASTSRNWRSAASPSVGSSPGGTAFRPPCRGRRPR